MKNPTDIYYTNQHLWVRLEPNNTCIAGITDYAQDTLGDIVYVEAPKADTILSAGLPCGLVESVKTGSDLHAPLDGTVTEINTALQGNPELINDKPYQTWIFKFTPKNLNDLKKLMNAETYQTFLNPERIN